MKLTEAQQDRQWREEYREAVKRANAITDREIEEHERRRAAEIAGRAALGGSRDDG